MRFPEVLRLPSPLRCEKPCLPLRPIGSSQYLHCAPLFVAPLYSLRILISCVSIVELFENKSGGIGNSERR